LSRRDVRLLALRMAPAGPEVALLDASGRALQRARPGARAEALAPLVGETLAEAGLGFPDLEALAVAIGPGSFTATRAAVAAVRALALATDSPVYALNALELAAETVAEARGSPLLVLGPAGRDGFAAQRFDAHAVPEGPPALLERDAALAAARAAARVVLVDLEDWAGPPALRVRSDALAVARAAAARAARRIPPVPGPAVRPLYLRPPDARLEAGRPLVVAA
jgi:tRNA threonylcarbamoyladenosine biosynthesis protein TsaB